MMHFIAYNKDAEWGAIEPGGDYFGHWSRHSYRRLQETLGETVWVISGERVDGKMVYRLCHYYRPENIEEEGGSCLVEGPGRGFERHLDVTDEDWFQELYQEQNNFSYGLNRIKSERVIEALLKLRDSEMGELPNDSRIAPVKALTIRPVMAWAILHAGKNIENRSWRTHIRGPIAIHAAKGLTRGEYEEGGLYIPRQYRKDIPSFEEIPRSAIIGVVDLVGCVNDSKSIWFRGDYGFVLKNPRPIKPIECSGALSFWDIPPDVKHKIKRQL